MSYLLPVYPRSPYMFTHGQGVYLFDKNNRKFLDFAGGIAVNSIGHSHPHLVKALQAQAAKLWHVSNLYQIEGLEELAERICKATDFADYIFFCNSGAEAVECGIKNIRKYQNDNGTKRYRIITFEGAFHGRTLATISAAKKDKLLKGFEPAVEGFDQVPFGDLEAVKKAITPETGGILIEPVQGEGGIKPASKEFLQGLRQICDERDMLLMFDGVQCGMGRTGKFFSHEWAGVAPDICASAKGIGGGFPLGACLSTKKAGSVLDAGTHGSTYAGNPLSVAVSHAVMDIMLAPGFLENVVNVGDYLMDELEKLKAKYPNVIENVRGKGLMIGIKINQAGCGLESRDVCAKLREKNLLTAPAAENVIRLLPPLILTKEEAAEGIKIIEQFCSEL
jgi:acetylornithine/N-succinyldiaminopimelate aminotransferase